MPQLRYWEQQWVRLTRCLLGVKAPTRRSGMYRRRAQVSHEAPDPTVLPRVHHEDIMNVLRPLAGKPRLDPGKLPLETGQALARLLPRHGLKPFMQQHSDEITVHEDAQNWTFTVHSLHSGGSGSGDRAIPSTGTSQGKPGSSAGTQGVPASSAGNPGTSAGNPSSAGTQVVPASAAGNPSSSAGTQVVPASPAGHPSSAGTQVVPGSSAGDPWDNWPTWHVWKWLEWSAWHGESGKWESGERR